MVSNTGPEDIYTTMPYAILVSWNRSVCDVHTQHIVEMLLTAVYFIYGLDSLWNHSVLQN